MKDIKSQFVGNINEGKVSLPKGYKLYVVYNNTFYTGKADYPGMLVAAFTEEQAISTAASLITNVKKEYLSANKLSD